MENDLLKSFITFFPIPNISEPVVKLNVSFMLITIVQINPRLVSHFWPASIICAMRLCVNISTATDVPPQPHPSPISNMAAKDVLPELHPSRLANMAGASLDGASKKGRTVYSSASCDPVEPCQGVLSFESRFESGNLQLATQV